VQAHARRHLTPISPIAFVLVLALAGCGTGANANDRSHRPAGGQASAHHVTEAKAGQQLIEAEASDLTQYSTCPEWLGASQAARRAYLLAHWPHLHPRELVRVVHDQSISCRVAPPAGGRTAMDPLQASVDLVVYGLAIFYEETLAVGIRESVDHYDLRAMHLEFSPPSRPSLLHRRRPKAG
jgi:hypothetical protein